MTILKAMRLWLFSFLILISVTPSSFATDAAEKAVPEVTESYGLAMHGAAKYSADSTHLDYVNPDAPKGGAITQAAIGTFDTLNPFSIKGKAAKGLNLYYDRLMGRVWDEPFTLYPLIAEKAEMPDDRSSITFTLNPAAKFNDGTSITAEDVIFSFETLRDHGRPNMQSVYKIVDKVEKTAKRTITFTFTDKYDQETGMILAMMPVLSKAWWSERDFAATTLDTPLSSGPYTIETADPGRSITYKRNEDYWAKDLLTNVGHHNFETIKYDYFRDDGVAFEAFKSGDTSLRLEADSTRWHKGYTIPSSKKTDLTKAEITHQRPERTRGMIFNTRREPFNDIRVRRALSMVLDFDTINTMLFNKDYKQIDSFYPNSELSHHNLEGDEDTPKPVKDLRTRLKAAGDLLTQSDWIIQNGQRMKEGKPLEFELLLSAPEDEKIALHYKKSLDRLGVTLKIRSLDRASFIDRIQEYDYDMVLYYWNSSLSPGTEQILYWGCEAAKQPGRFNYAGICDTEVERLAKRVPHTRDRKTLVATMQKLDRILMAGHYMVPLHYAGYDRYAYWTPINRPTQTPIYGAVLETWWMDGATTTVDDEEAAEIEATEETKESETEETEKEPSKEEPQTDDVEDFSNDIMLEMLNEIEALENINVEDLIPADMLPEKELQEKTGMDNLNQ